MSKKNKNSSLKAASPFKVILPVLIGLALIVVTCTIIVIANRPVKSASVENPKDIFLEIGDLKVTNQEMYEALRASGGISNFTFIVDKVLLANVEVTDADIEEAMKDAVFGDEIENMEEELADLEKEINELPDGDKKNHKQKEYDELQEDINEAKEKALRAFEFNIKSLGYDTEAEQKEYFTLLAKRNVYAKKAYNEYVKEDDFTDEQYAEAFKNENPDKYVSSSYVISVVFQSSNQAKNYLSELFNIDTANLVSAWNVKISEEEKTKKEAEIETLKAEIETLKAEIEAETDETVKAEKEKVKEDKEAKITTLEKELKATTPMEDYEIALAFVELYNRMNVYYHQVANINECFNEDGTVKEEYKFIKESSTAKEKAQQIKALEDTIKVLEKEIADTTDETEKENKQTIVNNHKATITTLKDEIKNDVADGHYYIKEEVSGEKTIKTVEFIHSALVKLSEENEFCKFVFTDAEAKSILSSTVSSTLVATNDKDPNSDKATKNYVSNPTQAGSKLYYLAYKYGSYTAPEKSEYETLADEIADLQKEIKDLTDEAKKAEKQKTLDEKLAKINEIKERLRPTLIEDTFNENEQTRLLVELRQDYEIKLYDRFLNASYKAAYEYLYGTTLKWEEGTYEEYKGDGKKHKVLAFSFKDLDGNVVEYSAQKFFEELSALYAHQAASTMVGDYAFLNNKDYNKIYNPYTGKVYNRDSYRNLFESDYSTISSELMSGVVNSVQAYKFAFEQGLFASNGFDEKYGWKPFLRDYLLAKNEKDLAGNLALDDAEEVFTLTKTDYQEVLKEMQKIYDAYYSVNGLNLVITVDYNNDGTPDTYVLEGEQENWTAYQMSLVQELSDLLYAGIENETETGLQKKLQAVATKYNEATDSDEKWGKYIKAGIRVKVEDAADYKSSASLVQEFHDQMAKYYLEIEKAEGYKLGAWTDDEKADGYRFNEVFTTSYGYHRVTILNASERIYINKDKSLDLTKLTLETYEKYVEDPSQFDETTTTAIKTYLEAALNKVISSNELSLLKAELRQSLIDENKVKFTNENIYNIYKTYESDYRAYVKELIADEQAEA